MRYKLRTLMILLAAGPPVGATGWYWFSRTGLAGLGLIIPLGLIYCYVLAWRGVFALLRAAERMESEGQRE